MSNISDIFKQYSKKLDHLDLELLIAHILKKPREFVIAHPDFAITKKQETIIKHLISRRLKHEPMAYILGHKEFYGLDFNVDKSTLIPRPETEMLVDLALKELKAICYPPAGRTGKIKASVIDVGTGSGNIIIAIAKKMGFLKFYGIDISEKVLRVAKQNAKLHKIDKKIKFIKGDLLKPFFPPRADRTRAEKTKNYLPTGQAVKLKTKNLLITANLPYLSEKIYNATMPDVKNYEPKSALLSGKDGLDHYRKLFSQIKKLKEKCFMLHVACFMEISPEQKNKLPKLINSHFPDAKVTFYKDLAGKWRVCEIEI